MKKWLWIGADSLLLMALTVVTLCYISGQKQTAMGTGRFAFEEAVQSMEQISQGYLEHSQNICCQWANYINGQSYTTEQANAFLRDVSPASGMSAQIVPKEKLNGMRLAENAAWQMTEVYADPVSGELTFSFFEDIDLVDAQGERFTALLLLSVPVERIMEQCEFSEAYDSAELSLIHADGSYLASGSSAENFWEEIGAGLSGSREAELREEMASSSGGSFLLTDKEGGDSCYAYQHMKENPDWLLVGCIPLSALHKTTPNWALFGTMLGCFCLLLAVNAASVRSVQKKLRAGRQEIDVAAETQRQWLAMVSQELRSSAGVIISVSGDAAKRLEDRPYVKECLRKLMAAGNQLLFLNDAQELADGGTESIRLEPAMFSLADSIIKIVSLILPRIKEKDLRFEIHIHAVEYEYLYADELRFSQVLFQLLSSSVKHSQVGGTVLVDISEEVCEKNPERLRLCCTVNNNGGELPEELIKILNEPFSATAGNWSRLFSAEGMELSLSRQIVGLMGGRLEAKRNSEGGMCFTATFELPYLDQKPEKNRLAGVRFLLVDDDEELLTAAKETLVSMGGTADCAASGDEAVERIAAAHASGDDYEIVILDWQMPKTSGQELLRRIREAGGETPYVLVSSYDWTEIEEEALAAGANGFLEKPLFGGALERLR